MKQKDLSEKETSTCRVKDSLFVSNAGILFMCQTIFVFIYVFVSFSRYFIDNNALLDHQKSKQHKRRLKKLLDEPYTQEEAEKAAGMGSYHYEHNKKMKIE